MAVTALRPYTSDEFTVPECNSYVVTVDMSGVSKKNALKLAEAFQSLCDHENVGVEITVAHVKYFA